MGKQWNHIRKVKARHDTVIDTYRQWSNRTSLLDGLYYWTMCGKCGENGKVLPMYEFDHVIKSKLIRPNQWIGVEKNKEYYKHNKSISHHGGQWLYGDFIQKYQELCWQFPPGLINIDTYHFYEKATDLLADVLLLSEMSHKVMVICNIVKEHDLYRPLMSDGETEEILSHHAGLSEALWKGWRHSKYVYEYDGTGVNSRTRMVTWSFVRQHN